jgi:hypothetical protein
MRHGLLELGHELRKVRVILGVLDPADQLAGFAVLVLAFIGELFAIGDFTAHDRIEDLFFCARVLVELVADLDGCLFRTVPLELREEPLDFSMIGLDQLCDVGRRGLQSGGTRGHARYAPNRRIGNKPPSWPTASPAHGHLLYLLVAEGVGEKGALGGDPSAPSLAVAMVMADVSIHRKEKETEPSRSSRASSTGTSSSGAVTPSRHAEGQDGLLTLDDDVLTSASSGSPVIRFLASGRVADCACGAVPPRCQAQPEFRRSSPPLPAEGPETLGVPLRLVGTRRIAVLAVAIVLAGLFSQIGTEHLDRLEW